MKLISSLSYTAQEPSVIALGCFDGVHLGHVAVIEAAKRHAKALRCPCTVWTFAEPPKNFFRSQAVPLLTDADEKQARIDALGADTLVCIPFDHSIASLDATAFVEELLIGRLKACHLVCGYNYHFGAKGAGNTDLMQTLCEKNRIGLTVVEPITIDGLPISSSEIRLALSEGRPEDAQAMLGRAYSITETVTDGQHLARTLGFPTINQIFPKKRAVPRAGVYLTRATLADGRRYFGISNVGTRPTVADHTLCAESHLFDFSGDLYGQTVTVEFLSFLRAERKFDSVDALAEQVRADMQTAKQLSVKQGDR